MCCLQEQQRAQALQQVSDERLEAAVQEGLKEARERQAVPGLPSASEGQKGGSQAAPDSSDQRELETSNKT